MGGWNRTMEDSMTDSKRADSGGRPIKVGVIADQTGPLSVMGLANANVARMVIGDLNAKGGLLGRHVKNQRVREVVTAHGGSIVGEEYFPLDHTDYRATLEKIASTGADVVFNTIVPPGLAPFFEQLHDSGFTRRGGQLVCTYFDENVLSMLPAAHADGLYSCLDYYQTVDDPFSRKLLAQYDALYPGHAKFTGGSACSGLYRGLRMWAAAVTQAGSLTQLDVIAALDHAQIGEGPGGPAAMVPGQHHVRTNMYIARARSGRFEIVERPGAIDPQERLVAAPATAV